MRQTTRAAVLAFLAVLGSVLIGVAAVLTAAITLAATTALIVPGTGTPKAGKVADYMQNAYNRYVASADQTLPDECTAANACTLKPVNYPASFWPLSFIPGWCVSGRCEKWNVSVEEGVEQLDKELAAALSNPDNDKIVLFGYSQGARVVSIEKETLANSPDKDRLEIVLIGNISRPNGGLWSRLSFLPTIPILDVSFGNPTPTDTGIKTTDISFEYDGVSDFPAYPLNLLAVANAIAGFQYVHGYYLVPNGNGPTDQLPWGYTAEEIQDLIENGDNPTKGDTTYVTIPARSLPILQPFIDLGNATGTSFIVNPILELVQPVLKVLIDTGYDRTANPGDPMTFGLIPHIDPIKLVVDLVAAVSQGIKDATDGVPIVPTVTPAPTSSSTQSPSPFAVQRSVSAVSVVSDDSSKSGQSSDDSLLVNTRKTDPKPADDNVNPLSPVNSGQATDSGQAAKPVDNGQAAKPADNGQAGKPGDTERKIKPFQIGQRHQPKPRSSLPANTNGTTQTTKPRGGNDVDTADGTAVSTAGQGVSQSAGQGTGQSTGQGAGQAAA